MSNEYKDWQAEEIKELRARVAEVSMSLETKTALLTACEKERDDMAKVYGLGRADHMRTKAREQQLREALETLHPPGAINEFESLILEPIFSLQNDTIDERIRDEGMHKV